MVEINTHTWFFIVVINNPRFEVHEHLEGDRVTITHHITPNPGMDEITTNLIFHSGKQQPTF